MTPSQKPVSLEASSRLQASIALPGMECQIYDCEWERPTEALEVLRDHVIWLSLSPLPESVSVEFEPLRGHYCKAGYVNFAPAGQEMRARSNGGAQRLLVCRVKPRQLESVLDRRIEYSAPELLAGLDLRDPEIRNTLTRMARELLSPGLASGTLMESLSTSLLIDVGRYLHLRRADCESGNGRLTSWQLRRITDSAEAERQPRLSELARMCGVSVRHLERMFKASTGETVQQFLAARQLARARSLLADGELPLKAIAIQLGFRHAASFAVAFRRSSGETPSGYRQRNRCGRAA
ncbi:MAG: hypothetical protein JWQ90_3865 [Hydrocarboniphaga sp.]|uniref:helix-turn-helix transcriptional regulator n=1 Tax=Hydrocarboniphaga sp. TaxID=2033016 RepID=UPI002623CC28|nr:helix-turn-helix transcriptional regulator [Hydrocarboniphaga sp.]MDB5971415.1 hypothetical protein [Hydrocarboniphaga sp.]